MDRLSSCYFCGSALEASLVEYAVVPDGLDPDDQQATVVVCQGCKRKLDAIVDRVVDSVADAEQLSRSRHETGVGQASVDVESENTLDTAGDAGSSTADAEDRPSASPAETDAGEDTAVDPLAGSDGADERSNGNGSDASDEAVSEPDSSAEDPDDGQTISALEYNKVMRLIQNREFPIDRGEIETVAASAYDVDRADCARIVDAAIERGLLEEDQGRLRKPASDS